MTLTAGNEYGKESTIVGPVGPTFLSAARHVSPAMIASGRISGRNANFLFLIFFTSLFIYAYPNSTQIYSFQNQILDHHIISFKLGY